VEREYARLWLAPGNEGYEVRCLLIQVTAPGRSGKVELGWKKAMFGAGQGALPEQLVPSCLAAQAR
jgi:hypothetical protein